MGIVYGKTLTVEEDAIVTDVAFKCGIMKDTARLLFYRGIDSVEKARCFLNPSKAHFINPFLLNNMQNAKDRIAAARENGEKIMIFGDYDADGICATTILYYALKEYGINAAMFIPERSMDYGLNVEKVASAIAEDGIRLIITVDCGISEYQKIEVIKSLGADVIVTDHHEPPEILPDCICINPKIKGQSYGFADLCGAGVAYKLAYALIGGAADKYLDYVALATIADSMELVGENRDLVAEGLKLFNGKKLRKSFAYLLGENVNEITASTITYSVAPKVNAGGRVGDVASVLRFFISENPNEIFDLSVKLNQYNIERQAQCDRIFCEAKTKIAEQGLDKNSVIFVRDDGWGSGFIGIVSAKLVETYNRPVIVFTVKDGYYKGSARSVDGVNIYEAINDCKDLLLAYGGHSQAAGVSVSGENYEVFRKRICEYVDKNAVISGEATFFAEWDTSKRVSLAFAREINLLEPFGVANRRPLFTVTVGKTEVTPMKKKPMHVTFDTPATEMLYFNGNGVADIMRLPVSKKVLYELNLSVFNGKESMKGFVRKVFPEYGDFSALRLHIFRNELLKLKNGDCEIDGQDYAESKDVAIEGGFGTLYAVCDPKTLDCYEVPNSVSVNLFSPALSGSRNCVVVSPSYLPDGYGKIVYLDKPYTLLPSETEKIICADICGRSELYHIDIDRTSMINYYNYIRSLCGKSFYDSADYFSAHESGVYEGAALVFAYEVFSELGFFYTENGVLKRNVKAQDQLTASALYRKALYIKG